MRNVSPLPAIHTSPTVKFGTAVTSTAAGSVGESSVR
jgi:hypothetical protein